MPETLAGPWWLPKIVALFRKHPVVRSKQIAQVFGDYTPADSLTRIRLAGLPLKVAGYVPGRKWNGASPALTASARYYYVIPAENKADSFGYWRGHLVAIDYGN